MKLLQVVSKSKYCSQVKKKKKVLKSFVANGFETESNESARRVAPDHHSVEQREAATQPEQMAPDARPPHRDGRQEEGERPPLLRALSDSMTKCCSGSLSAPAPASPGLPLFDPSSSFISPSILSSYARHPRRSVQRFASISVKLSPSLSPARSVVLSLIISGLPRVKFYSASRRPRQSTRCPAARGPDNTQPALTGAVFVFLFPPPHPTHRPPVGSYLTLP